ncbi:MAG: T9SS type A sorting domain-containing protein, partial [Bacteroidaceae bacterium]
YSAVSSFAVRGPLGISNGTSSISVEYASDHLPVILDVKDNMVTGIEQMEGDKTSISRQNNELHINSLADNTNYSYQFYSTLGACVNSGSIEKDDSISLVNLNDGVYILRLTDNEKYVANWKFIK